MLHYWWLVKKDITQPAIYAAVLALLLGYRLWFRLFSSETVMPEPNNDVSPQRTSGFVKGSHR